MGSDNGLTEDPKIAFDVERLIAEAEEYTGEKFIRKEVREFFTPYLSKRKSVWMLGQTTHVSGIYQIECVPTQDRYVGKAGHINGRWYQHLCGITDPFESENIGIRTARLARIYSPRDFRFGVIMPCDPIHLSHAEDLLICALRPSLNAPVGCRARVLKWREQADTQVTEVSNG